MTSVAYLPPEVVGLILNHLSHKEIIKLLQVNQHWFNIVSQHLFRHLQFRDVNHLKHCHDLFHETAKNRKHNTTSFYSARNYANAVRVMDFSLMENRAVVTRNIMQTLIHDCSCLETLNLYNCLYIDNSTISTVLRECQLLRNLHLAGVSNISASVFTNTAAPNLQLLNIVLNHYFFEDVKKDDIHTIASNLPSLQTLKMSQVVLHRGVLFTHFMDMFPSLKHILIHHARSDMIQTLLRLFGAQLCKVEILASRFQASDLHNITSNLEVFHLEKCRIEYPHRASLLPISHCHQLQSLELTGTNTNITANQMISIIKQTTHLRRFLASPTVCDKVLEQIRISCPILNTLSLTSSDDGISFDELENIFTMYQNTLTDVRLDHHALSDSTTKLDNLLLGWPSNNLQVLCLMTKGGCSPLFIRKLAELYPNLRVLQLSVAREVTNMDVDHSLELLKNLEACNINFYSHQYGDAPTDHVFKPYIHYNTHKTLETKFALWQQHSLVW